MLKIAAKREYTTINTTIAANGMAAMAVPLPFNDNFVDAGTLQPG
jgi:hypothetical protein